MCEREEGRRIRRPIVRSAVALALVLLVLAPITAAHGAVVPRDAEEREVDAVGLPGGAGEASDCSRMCLPPEAGSREPGPGMIRSGLDPLGYGIPPTQSVLVCYTVRLGKVADPIRLGGCTAPDDPLSSDARIPIVDPLPVHASDRDTRTDRLPGTRPADGDRPEDRPGVHRARSVAAPTPRPGPDPALVSLLVGTAVVPLLAWAVLYRRLSDDDILDHDLRARIVEIVREDPGVHFAELADRLGVAKTTVLYHVRLLEEFGKLALDESGRETRCYTPRHDRRVREMASWLRSEAKRTVLEVVAGSPGIHMSEVARRLDKDRSTVKYHVDALADAGMLETGSGSGTRSLSVPDEVREALERS